jgi:hypothetical protein
VPRFIRLLLLLSLLCPSAAATQSRENPASSSQSAKTESSQAPAPKPSSKDPKEPSPAATFSSPFPGVESGSASGNLYQNGFLGSSYEFPKDWIAEKATTLHEINRKWDLDARLGPPDLRFWGLVRLVHGYSPKVIFYASASGKGDGNLVSIPSIRVGAQRTDERFLDTEKLRRKFEHADQKTVRLLRIPDSFALKGHPFFRVEVEGAQGTTRIWVSRMQTYLTGHMVLFEFYASSEEELQRIAATIQSVSFNKDKP